MKIGKKSVKHPSEIQLEIMIIRFLSACVLLLLKQVDDTKF